MTTGKKSVSLNAQLVYPNRRIRSENNVTLRERVCIY